VLNAHNPRREYGVEIPRRGVFTPHRVTPLPVSGSENRTYELKTRTFKLKVRVCKKKTPGRKQEIRALASAVFRYRSLTLIAEADAPGRVPGKFSVLKKSRPPGTTDGI